MADDTSTAAPPIPDSLQHEMEMTKAGLTHDEAVQFEATLAPKLADGTVEAHDIYHAQFDAVAAHDAFEHAKTDQHEAAQAAHEGNLGKAEELGVNAGYYLHRAEESGGASAHPTIEALEDKQDHTVQALGSARWEAATSHEYAVDANSNAAAGHYEAAAASAETAQAHHEDAQAHVGDAGYHHDDTSSSGAAEPAAAAETGGTTTE